MREVNAHIRWPAAVLGAAVVGGVAYGLLARGFQIGELVSGGTAAWLPTAVVSLLMLTGGALLLKVVHGTRSRTAAAALAMASATGGFIALELFIAWVVKQLA